MNQLTFVCRGMGEGGGIQRVIAEITAEIIKNEELDFLNIVSDNFPDELKGIEKVKLIKSWSPSNNKLAKKLPRYFFVMLCQPIFILTSSILLKLQEKKLGPIFNHGVGQCLVQDIVVFHSCHHEWVAFKKEKKGFKGLLSPLDWMIKVCEKINVSSNKGKNLVAVSELTKVQIQKHFNAKDIAVIPNGVNVNRFIPSENRNEMKRSLGIKESDQVVLFVANEWKRKGLEEVVKSISEVKEEVPNVRLLVVGRNLKKALDDFMIKYDVEEHVIYLNETQEIEKIYQISDVFCVPSKEDAFGLVFVEAMASNLPIITTDRCGVHTYIKNGENGFVLPLNEVPFELTNLLVKLLNNEELRKKIGEQARKTVVNEMSWEKIADQYYQIAAEYKGK